MQRALEGKADECEDSEGSPPSRVLRLFTLVVEQEGAQVAVAVRAAAWGGEWPPYPAPAGDVIWLGVGVRAMVSVPWASGRGCGGSSA